MVDSLRQFGQIFPVVVVPVGEGYELVDGFKRLRALKQLGYAHVCARVVELSVPSLKAAMLTLNRRKGAVSDWEEAMVVHSVCREDGLSQAEAAVLLGRHKSWVCRRLSLVERLCEEAQEDLRLGLICASIGRELGRLPRGNQPAALASILKYRLCSRESARLVSLLLQRPRWEWPSIVTFPEPILEARQPPRPAPPREGLSPAARLLLRKLGDLQRRIASLVQLWGEEGLRELPREDWPVTVSALEGMQTALQDLKRRLYGGKPNVALGGI
jgi:ParB/RepB/Spo0J family partition protein